MVGCTSGMPVDAIARQEPVRSSAYAGRPKDEVHRKMRIGATAAGLRITSDEADRMVVERYQGQWLEARAIVEFMPDRFDVRIGNNSLTRSSNDLADQLWAAAQ